MSPQINLHETSVKESNYWQMPAMNGSVVTASDTGSINACRGIYIGSAGDVKVKFASDPSGNGGQDALLAGVVAGSILPISIIRVYSTSTTAGSIVALY